jgi:A/G-specific adenine glycosylase
MSAAIERANPIETDGASGGKTPEASPIAAALIAWHAAHGRHDLPWQRARTPYRVWISEIMLQQTQVATVIGYYERFMARFPDVATLAAAPLDEVLHAWSGLGYYSRVRNLRSAAQRILTEHGGRVPEELASLERLPGIGRSTAAAILALALDRRAAILDGNVRRVLSRYFGIDGSVTDPAVQRRLWQQAERCTPLKRVAIYTQAIMDLGATVCTRGTPRCPDCPLVEGCIARRSGRVAELPGARRRAARAARAVVMLLAVAADGSVLLRQRPSRGVWAGLWTPPEFDSVEIARAFCAAWLPSAAGQAPALVAMPTMRHAFTHFDLTISPFQVRCESHGGAVMEEGKSLWYNPREPARIGLPAPVRTLLASVTSAFAQPPVSPGASGQDQDRDPDQEVS